VAVPARYALERRNWNEAAAITMPAITFSWARYPWAEAIIVYTHALGSARTGNVAAAEKDVERLAALRDALTQAKNTYWADQVEIQRRAAAAWVARAEGKNDEALELMRAAADLEDSTEKHPVTPAPVVPARELLGEMLLDLNQPAPALVEFEASLVREPNRFNGLYGAARAAELSGNTAKARALYERLMALCDRADGDRPELKHAKAALAK